MKRKIFCVILALSVALTVVTGILAAVICYGFYMTEAESQVRTLLRVAAQDPENWESSVLAEKASKNFLDTVNYSLRITAISPDGTVMYDNMADVELMDDHSSRPEVEEALLEGQGENIRFSSTLSSNVYYCAELLANGYVLRFAREIKSIRSLFAGVVPVMTVMVLFIITVASFLSSWLAEIIVRPVGLIATSLDSITDGEAPEDVVIYDELIPFADRIRRQTVKINEYIQEIRRETDTIGIITKNMQEGFIMMDPEGWILTINQSALRMLGSSNYGDSGKRNIVELCRAPEFLGGIDEALSGVSHVVKDLDQDGRYHRCYINQVQKGGEPEGLFVLIEDVTAQVQSEIMRREFSANVSHELKTPLTTINGFAEMIKEGLITDMDSIKKYCAMINREGDRLIALIDDIIRLSEIEEKREALSEDVDLAKVLEDVFSMLGPKAKKSSVLLESEAEHIIVRANYSYMSELFYNLIDNAIKYNVEGGSVHVSVRREGSHAVISVKDTGCGIPAEHLSRIFERFYRVDKSRSKETGGTGLGLSIVKHIAEACGGFAGIQSTVREGTEIFVKLPV